MNKKIISIISLLALVFLLAACGEDEKTAKDTDIKKGKEYDLVWYELINNGNESSASYEISYMKDGKQKYVKTSAKNIREKILRSPDEKATVSRKGSKFIIKRQPMNVMYQKDIKGKVKSKEVIE